MNLYLQNVPKRYIYIVFFQVILQTSNVNSYGKSLRF